MRCRCGRTGDLLTVAIDASGLFRVYECRSCRATFDVRWTRPTTLRRSPNVHPRPSPTSEPRND